MAGASREMSSGHRATQLIKSSALVRCTSWCTNASSAASERDSAPYATVTPLEFQRPPYSRAPMPENTSCAVRACRAGVRRQTSTELVSAKDSVLDPPELVHHPGEPVGGVEQRERNGTPEGSRRLPEPAASILSPQHGTRLRQGAGRADVPLRLLGGEPVSLGQTTLQSPDDEPQGLGQFGLR